MKTGSQVDCCSTPPAADLRNAFPDSVCCGFIYAAIIRAPPFYNVLLKFDKNEKTI
ncbi:hypothetical protein ACR1PO_03270 [Chryseobacterium sp. RRHN12]|uniref:hypothetical protein n=1 Tax=Chryseobacterium sp. RRHN12 TaxID=3437884 RepID=UPI003D9B7B21